MADSIFLRGNVSSIRRSRRTCRFPMRFMAMGVATGATARSDELHGMSYAVGTVIGPRDGAWTPLPPECSTLGRSQLRHAMPPGWAPRPAAARSIVSSEGGDQDRAPSVYQIGISRAICGRGTGMANGGCVPGSGRLVGAYIRIRCRTRIEPFRSYTSRLYKQSLNDKNRPYTTFTASL